MPQLEDGYTRIANELMEQVPKFKFNGTQLRIIIVIWRFTYGFKRKDHEFSVSFLAEAIDASRSQVDRELTALIDRNVVQVMGYGSTRSRILQFNKNYEEWSNERCTRNGVQAPDVLQNEDDMYSSLGMNASAKTGNKKEIKKTLKKGMVDLGVHKQIIEYLNARAGKRFSHKSAANQKLINGRIAEGRTVEDFFYVIDIKCSHWLKDEKMNDYLRPSTLFSQKNFENYLNQSPKQEPQRDKSLSSRDKEVEFQRWLQEGNDPNEFDWNG